MNPGANLHIASSSGMALEYLTAGDNSQAALFFATSYSGTADYAGIGIRTDGSLALTGGASIASPNMVIDNSGNVGIGTISPASRLSVHGSNAFTEPYAATSFFGRRPDGVVATLGIGYDATHVWHQDVGSDGGLVFYYMGTGSGEKARITSTGNVGIGTNAPEAQLHIGSNDGAKDNTQKLRLSLEPPSHSGGAWQFKTRDDTNCAYMDIGYAGTNAMTLMNTGNVGIGTTAPEAKLHISAGDSSFAKFGPNATWDGSLVIGAGVVPTSGGTYSPISGRAVIHSSNGNLHLDAGASQSVYIGYVNATATYISGSWYGSSDQRLKKNIQTIPDSKGLVAINKLKPVSYTRLDNPGGGTQLGFIAQQVQSIFPELVSNSAATTLTPGGTLAINYIGLLPPIVKAIQELKKQNEILQAENKQQDSRIKKLEVKLNKNCK
ncbi:MAG: tail fiber domain-containing protein [Candidatus Omnitrophica bacterium]|nr:tail fiber domain-containing protein [Candidatus Omnitrophota bacterium]